MFFCIVHAFFSPDKSSIVELGIVLKRIMKLLVECPNANTVNMYYLLTKPLRYSSITRIQYAHRNHSLRKTLDFCSLNYFRMLVIQELLVYDLLLISQNRVDSGFNSLQMEVIYIVEPYAI